MLDRIREKRKPKSASDSVVMEPWGPTELRCVGRTLLPFFGAPGNLSVPVVGRGPPARDVFYLNLRKCECNVLGIVRVRRRASALLSRFEGGEGRSQSGGFRKREPATQESMLRILPQALAKSWSCARRQECRQLLAVHRPPPVQHCTWRSAIARWRRRRLAAATAFFGWKSRTFERSTACSIAITSEGKGKGHNRALDLPASRRAETRGESKI